MRLYEGLYLPLLSAAPPWSTRDIRTRPFLPVFTVAPCEDRERCEEGCTREVGVQQGEMGGTIGGLQS